MVVPPRGTRAMLTMGPSMTLLPFIFCSRAMALAYCPMRSRSQLQATVRVDGHAVT